MAQIAIFPGTLKAICRALDIYGEKHALVGDQDDPIFVDGLTAEEVVCAKKFFGDMGCEVEEIEVITIGAG